jgi:hypothetical protein
VTRRIPAAGAIVGSTTVSALLALCVLGGVAGGVAAQAPSVASQTVAAQTVAGQTSPLETTPMTIAMTSGIESALAVSSAADTTVRSDVQPGLGLLGGAAADQIPVVAQVSNAAAAKVSVVAPANVSVGAPAKLSIAVPASLAATAIALTPKAATPIALTPKAVTPKAATPIALPAIAGTPRQMAYAVAVRAGLSAQQWSCLSQLWQQESKFQTTVRNGRSGAYGIPQALPASRMASAGADWRTNPVTQIQWGLRYISTRYGTACTAWSHWKRYRWY